MCCQLQGVDGSKDFGEIAPCGGRIKDGQLQPLIRPNHKHLSNENAFRERLIDHECFDGLHVITCSVVIADVSAGCLFLPN